MGQALNGNKDNEVRELAKKMAAFTDSLNQDQTDLLQNLVGMKDTSLGETTKALNNYRSLTSSLSADQANLFALALGASQGNLLSANYGDMSLVISMRYIDDAIYTPLAAIQRDHAMTASKVLFETIYSPNLAGQAKVGALTRLAGANAGKLYNWHEQLKSAYEVYNAIH